MEGRGRRLCAKIVICAAWAFLAGCRQASPPSEALGADGLGESDATGAKTDAPETTLLDSNGTDTPDTGAHDTGTPDTDIPDDGAPETADAPDADADSAVDGECLDHSQCDDGDPATLDVCKWLVGTCTHTLDPNWQPCKVAEDCDDGELCTYQTCTDEQCVFWAIDLCCTITADCDDSNPITKDYCVESLHICGHVGTGTEPCDTDGQCQDLSACTQDVCVDGKCVHNDVQNCCLNLYDCWDDLPCTEDACVQNQCVYQLIFTCTDGQSCTVDTHETGGCGCTFTSTLACGTPACPLMTCNDQNPCTLDTCDGKGSCVFTTIPNCAKCPLFGCDDDDPTTFNYCDPTGLCQFMPKGT